MKRSEATVEIIETLLELAKKNPSLRFGQLIMSCNLVAAQPGNDEFYTESETSLERLKNSYLYKRDMNNE